jgi:hypothetical protein
MPSATWVVVHHHGWYTGTGLLKIGSIVPNATDTTVYRGNRKKTASHRMPGSANDGQNHRG